MMLYSRFIDCRRALLLFLLIALAGCAAKNPLLDDTPVPIAKSARPADSAAAEQSKSTDGGIRKVRERRFLSFITPYRTNIQQGNFVSRELVAQLREGFDRPEGITAEQVRFLLGTPLLTDIFHQDRWDYAFRLERSNGEIISSQLTLYFKDNKLAKIDGGNLPDEQDYLALIAGPAPKIPASKTSATAAPATVAPSAPPSAANPPESK